MATYIVRVKEIVVQPVVIEADTEAEAIEKVLEGEGDYTAEREGLDWLPSSDWQVAVA